MSVQAVDAADEQLQKESALQTPSDTDPIQNGQGSSQQADSVETTLSISERWSQAQEETAASIDKQLDKPAHERAVGLASQLLLPCALYAALINSWFGVEFLEQWKLPQVNQQTRP